MRVLLQSDYVLKGQSVWNYLALIFPGWEINVNEKNGRFRKDGRESVIIFTNLLLNFRFPYSKAPQNV